MTSRLNPYLNFDGNAEEAMEFYRDVFGGTLEVIRYGDFGAEEPEIAQRIMHGQLETPSGFTLMGADVPPGTTLERGNDVAVSLSGDEAEELRGYWRKLADGGTVSVPLEVQMWGDEFGQCRDRFGVEWLVNLPSPESQGSGQG